MVNLREILKTNELDDKIKLLICLTFFDTVISQYIMPFVTIIACVIVGWLINKKEIDESFPDFKLRKVWIFFAKYVTPILVGVILFFGIFSFEGGFHFANDWRMILSTVVVALIFMSVNFIYLAVKKRQLKKSQAEEKTETENL